MILGKTDKAIDAFVKEKNTIFPDSADPSLCVFSSDNRDNINNSKFNASIFAENGLYFQAKGDQPACWTKTDECLTAQPILNWSQQLLKILKYYCDRVPNSNIEVLEVKHGV